MDASVGAERARNPRSDANVFEILTFSWMLNLFKKGRKRDLDENDLYKTLNDQTSSPLGDELEKIWKSELSNASKADRNPSLLRALIRMFGAKYMFYGFLLSIEEIVLRMSQPLFIGGLLAYFNPNGSNRTIGYAYMCASGILFSMLASFILRHSTSIAISNCGMKIRVACCSTIFRKALRLSHTALGETTIGQVINLLSNDVNRFDLGLFHLQYIWIGPLQTVLVTYFLWQEIGVSSILGIAMLFVFIPIQGWLGKKVFQLRFKTARKTDERGRLMNEIIAGIQVIKMYTWEKPFAKLIEYARKKEVRQIRGTSYINAISFMFRGIQIRLQLFISILAYVLLGNYISIQKVFVITSFYNLLQNTMSLFFCIGTAQVAEILVSIKRIQNFLLLEEKDVSTIVDHSTSSGEKTNGVRKPNEIVDVRNTVEMEKFSESVSPSSVGIVISNATAKWSDVQSGNSLENINLTVSSGRLAAIIGPVGAGKSSLIQSILRELPLSEGRISVRGVVSYASQEPWLFTGSVRQNILFNSPMDTDRYDQVVDVCALRNDFEQFPYGDRTMVGERGVTLSGGQRARINLARAIYKEADIYLLDDPLSAVDSRVGKYLFENCIKDYLREKICILVTHQIHFLTNVDQIVLMENARISAEGRYQELQASGIDFARFLGTPEETAAAAAAEVVADENATAGETYGKGPDQTPAATAAAERSESSNGPRDSCGGNGVPEKRSAAAPAEPDRMAETRSSGDVSKNVYASYFSAVGSACNVFCFFFMYVLTQVLTTGGDYWISYWVNQEEYVFQKNSSAQVAVDNSTLTTGGGFSMSALMSSLSLNSRLTCIVIYTVLVISLIVAIFVRSAIFVTVCTRASLNLHNRMFNAIIRATMYFFNTNSSGRILNRFSNDMGAIDEILPSILLDVLQTGMRILGIFIVVGLVDFYLIIPTIFVGVIFHYIRVFYLPTSRSFKRLEGVARSPVLSHMNASIQGLTTIRAFGAEQTISNEFDKHQDLHSSTWYLFICSNEAFGFWLDIVCFFYMCVVIFSFLVVHNDTYGGYVGLAITQTVGLVGLVQWEIRQLASLENQMTSVERVLDYANCPQEADFESPRDKKPTREWPRAGNVVFKDFNLRYSNDSPYVLKNLNFRIRSKEKIGIVGRTGAGKSSIIAALFRLAHNEGSIEIDEVEIHALGLHDLRSKLSIIPQEPVLFSGTMRKNLDPFDEYADHVLWNALDEVELKTTVENLPGALNSKMSESGSNFSVGQKQLVCLARALVRNNKILVLDEATANVDAQTDALIQNTIRNKFRACTVLTVAHRLNTVMDSDRVLVMDTGSVVEFDHAFNLLKNKNGLLYSMVEQTGQATSDLLHSIAAESFQNAKINRKSPIQLIDEDVEITGPNETS